jgi:hypothetical protein
MASSQLTQTQAFRSQSNRVPQGDLSILYRFNKARKVHIHIAYNIDTGVKKKLHHHIIQTCHV